MSRDDLFAAEEDVIASGEHLISDGSFGSVEDKRRYQQLLKNYQKLFRTTRRLMRLSDHNEQRLNTAAEVISRKNKEHEALSTSCRNIYRRKFTTRFLLVPKIWKLHLPVRSSPSFSQTWLTLRRPRIS
jgi:hypothetical protein